MWICSLVVSISFFLLSFFHYGFIYLLENAIEMKTKSKFTFQSELFLPSANFIEFKVLKYLGIKVLAIALCSLIKAKFVRPHFLFDENILQRNQVEKTSNVVDFFSDI